MNLYKQLGPNDPVKALQNLRLLQADPWTIGQTQFFALFPDVFNSPQDRMTSVQSSIFNAPGVVVRNDTNKDLLVLLGGMVRNQNVPAILASMTFPNSVDSEHQGPPCFVRAARQFLPLCTASGGFGWSSVTIVGHSFGGATAMQLATFIYRQNNQGFTETYTYGAPRCALDGRRNFWADTRTYRSWTINDPVINIPPRLDELPVVVATLPAAMQAGSHTFCQPISGTSVDRGGILVTSSMGRPGLVPVPIEIGAWMIGSNAFGARDHLLSTYIDYWSNVTPFVIRSRNTPPITGPGDAEERLPQARRNRIVRQAFAEVGAANQADLGGAVQTVESNQVPVARARYRRRQSNGIWLVTYQDKVACVLLTKRAAKEAVRRLNRNLRERGF